MSEFENLYNETVEEMEKHGFTFDDVDWIVCKIVKDEYEDKKIYADDFGYDNYNYMFDAYEIPIDMFIGQAKKTLYYSGFGGQEINASIKIVFKDGSYFERREYDGAEWWEHVSVLIKPDMILSDDSRLRLKVE